MKRRNSFGFIFAGIIFLSLVVIVGAVNWIPAAYNVTYYASEDTVYHHNLSANISNGGAAVSFQILPDSQSPLIWNGTSYVTNVVSSWVYIANSTTGDLVINVTRNNQTGNFTIPLYVSSGGGGETQSFNFSVSAVNDKPQFVNLVNKTMNATESFNYIINTSDEENISGASLNLTFLGDCVPAQWTNRYNNNSVGNCTLFGNNNYVFNNNTGQINITFTPSRDNDVGVYHLNFTLSDAANASVKTSKDVYFTVLNVNQYPRFNYVCNNERNWTEGNIVSCWINVTDPDEINNLTLSVQTPKTINSSAVGSPANWFNFVGGSSSMTKNVSSATGFNASFPVNFSVGNNEVGNWFINFTLTDTGSPARMNSTLINFSVVNVNDNVSMDNVSDMVLATTSNYALNVLAHDNDLLINDKSVYNENLTFTSNTSWIGLVSTSTTLNSNLTTALFGIYPSLAGPGTYAVNISVRDKNNYSMDSKVFSITIIANNPPSWNANTNSNITVLEGTNIYLNLSKNVTDLDHDTLNFSYSPTDCFDGLSNFSLNSSTGIINFTTDDVDVGEHLCNITVTDTKFASANLLFNFTINNLDENVTIHRPIRNMGSSNASLSVDNLTSNITITEDDIATVQFNASDSDLRIVQKNFCANCNQSLNVNLTLLSAPIGAN
ncbi:MAG: hypothetical protein WCK29_04140, partial [archaeon]